MAFLALDSALQNVHITQPPAPHQKKCVLYAGEGADNYCVEATEVAVQRILSMQVVRFKESDFDSSDWIASTRLIIIPGGYALAINKALRVNARFDRIKQAVNQHAIAYLGICAGGFLGCEDICANPRPSLYNPDPKPQYANLNDPTLSFFKGLGCYPVEPNTHEKERSRLITLQTDSGAVEGECFFEDGPYFSATNAHAIGTTVLARYTGLNVPAMVHITRDGINAIILGVHPEFPEGKCTPEYLKARKITRRFSDVVFTVAFQALNFLGFKALSKEIHALVDSYLPLNERSGFLEYVPKASHDHILNTRRSVLLYAGSGSEAGCVSATQEVIGRLLSTAVHTVTESYFSAPTWNQAIELIIIPGGTSAVTIDAALKPYMKHIQQAILTGKIAYIGIGAGAYVGAWNTELCEAVLLKKEKGSCTIELFEESGKVTRGNCYFEDGAEFITRPGTDRILAKAEDAGVAVAVHCGSQNANAVLFGIHPEFPTAAVSGQSLQAPTINRRFSDQVLKAALQALQVL